MSNGCVHAKGSFSLQSLIEMVKKEENFKKAGAIAVFVGVVRGENEDGEKVQKLEIEAYEEKANEVLSTICQELKKREGIVDVQIHHFLGEFSVGEDLVYVLVAGSHRENVFPVLREAVERYKKEAPLFKKEFVVSGKGEAKAYWVAEKEKQ
ncbi:MAG: molybdenum cofactor biosynthesis protein MoaE [Candidatus Bathyarchaeales archaeon]